MGGKKNTAQPAAEPVMHKESELFTFPTPLGDIHLPYIENLPMGLIEDNAGKPAGEFLSNVLVALMDEEAAKKRRSLTIQGFNTMVKVWDESSAITLGELFA